MRRELGPRQEWVRAAVALPYARAGGRSSAGRGRGRGARWRSGGCWRPAGQGGSGPQGCRRAGQLQRGGASDRQLRARRPGCTCSTGSHEPASAVVLCCRARGAAVEGRPRHRPGGQAGQEAGLQAGAGCVRGHPSPRQGLASPPGLAWGPAALMRPVLPYPEGRRRADKLGDVGPASGKVPEAAPWLAALMAVRGTLPAPQVHVSTRALVLCPRSSCSRVWFPLPIHPSGRRGRAPSGAAPVLGPLTAGTYTVVLRQ